MELLEQLKSSPEFRGIPVVMLTGSLVSEHIQKSYDLGAVTYLLKPISEDELLMVLSILT
jgi:two-component system response regulator